jgi:hypothetical protein
MSNRTETYAQAVTLARLSQTRLDLFEYIYDHPLKPCLKVINY